MNEELRPSPDSSKDFPRAVGSREMLDELLVYGQVETRAMAPGDEDCAEISGVDLFKLCALHDL